LHGFFIFRDAVGSMNVFSESSKNDARRLVRGWPFGGQKAIAQLAEESKMGHGLRRTTHLYIDTRTKYTFLSMQERAGIIFQEVVSCLEG
jgi:hypothetical protein